MIAQLTPSPSPPDPLIHTSGSPRWPGYPPSLSGGVVSLVQALLVAAFPLQCVSVLSATPHTIEQTFHVNISVNNSVNYLVVICTRSSWHRTNESYIVCDEKDLPG